MTAAENEIWRGAYDLFEWNRNMPNTEQAWVSFMTAVTEFANRYSWQECPLAKALAMAVIEAVEAEVRARQAGEDARPKQISLFEA